MSLLIERPPTPPASGTSSPPPYIRQRCATTTKPDESYTALPTATAEADSPSNMQTSWIRVEPPLALDSHSSLHSQDLKEPLLDFTASRSFTVWPGLEDIVPGCDLNKPSSSSSSATSSSTTSLLFRGTTARKPVTVHILSRDAGDPMMAYITKKLIAEGIPSERMSQQMIEELVQGMSRLCCNIVAMTRRSLLAQTEQLHFQHDPCLVVIQPIAFELASTQRSRQTTIHSSSQLPLTYRLLKRTIPTDPPQLHGYPFWPLRVTEI